MFPVWVALFHRDMKPGEGTKAPAPASLIPGKTGTSTVPRDEGTKLSSNMFWPLHFALG